MSNISPLAAIDPRAELAPDIEIGPFCVIGPDVKIDTGCRLISSVTILGQTTIGKNNTFFPNSVLGTAPQDKKYKGEPTQLIIGDNNTFREAVTVHPGTAKGTGVTRICDDNTFLVNAFIGHDATIHNHVTISNNVIIAGHNVCKDHVAIMANAAIHHFVTLHECSYITAFSNIHYDVPPFLIVDGPNQFRGINKIGLRRAGYTDSDIAALESAYSILFTRGHSLDQAIALLERENLHLNPCVQRLLEFLRRRDSA